MSRFAVRARESLIRRGLLNLYRSPTGEPTIGGFADVEAGPLIAYLEELNRSAPTRITVTHVVTKMIADSLRRWPELNVKIIGRRLYRLRHVDIRVAVNLFPDEEDSPEVSLVMVRDADKKTLADIAKDLSGHAHTARRLGDRKTLTGRLLRWSRYVPGAVFDPCFRVAHHVATSGYAPVLGLGRDPMGSTALTNVGPFGRPTGTHGLTAIGLLPRMGYASFFLAMPIEEKAVVVDGQVEARPVLPLGMAVDHRAIDGYKSFRYFYHWAEILAEPEKHFDSPPA